MHSRQIEKINKQENNPAGWSQKQENERDRRKKYTERLGTNIRPRGCCEMADAKQNRIDTCKMVIMRRVEMKSMVSRFTERNEQLIQ